MPYRVMETSRPLAPPKVTIVALLLATISLFNISSVAAHGGGHGHQKEEGGSAEGDKQEQPEKVDDPQSDLASGNEEISEIRLLNLIPVGIAAITVVIVATAFIIVALRNCFIALRHDRSRRRMRNGIRSRDILLRSGSDDQSSDEDDTV